VRAADAARVAALADQAAAANRDAARFAAVVAGPDGGRTALVADNAACARIVAELEARVAQARPLSGCPHLDPSGPRPMFWLPYLPAALLCSRCHDALMLGLRGTPEMTTCDGCRRRVPDGEAMYHSAVIRPALVVATAGGVAASGPLTVHFGLCEDCNADGQGAPGGR
jgi:hypothetical protein